MKPEADGFITIFPKLPLSGSLRACSYCHAQRHHKLMDVINGHWFCNKGHYRAYIQDTIRKTKHR